MKYFNCWRIVHFSNKCLYPKQEDSDNEELCCHKKDQKSKTIYKKKFNKNKKKIYSKEDIEDEEVSEYVEVLFMGLESEISEEKIKGVVDLKVELGNDIQELGKYNRMYKKPKTHMAEFEEKKDDT